MERTLRYLPYIIKYLIKTQDHDTQNQTEKKEPRAVCLEALQSEDKGGALMMTKNLILYNLTFAQYFTIPYIFYIFQNYAPCYLTCYLT